VAHSTDRYGGKTLEIGPGLGRTAYYARALGITDYTTVGLPMDLVVQAAFLGWVFSEDELAFPNEVAHPGQIRMLTPATLLSAGERVDMTIKRPHMNCSSFLVGCVARNRRAAEVLHDGLGEPNGLHSGNPRPHAGVSGARIIRVLADRRSRRRVSETSAEWPGATLAGSEAGQ
jgi:hypothetical protein